MATTPRDTYITGLVNAHALEQQAVSILSRQVERLESYPPELHGPVFAAFSAAWVVPSLVGPFAAGLVAQYLHWRWVFFGVAILALAAFALLAGRLGGLSAQAEGVAGTAVVVRRLGAAVAVALGLLVLGLSGATGPLALPIIAVALVAVVAAVRLLLPPGTLRAARALPSVILLRGVLAGAFFSAEVYVPFFFIEAHGFSPVWAGLALTIAAITWALASDLQGRVWASVSDTRMAVIGSALLSTSLVIATASALTIAPPAVLIAAWALGAAGMGIVFPRLSVLTLAYSTPSDQGANSAALSISDAVGAAGTIAVLGLVFTALPADIAFPAAFACAAAVGALTFIPARRVR